MVRTVPCALLALLLAACGREPAPPPPAPEPSAEAVPAPEPPPRHHGGFSPERLERLTEGMQRHVDGGLVAGVVTLVHRAGERVHSDVLGWQDAEAEVPMQRDTLFRIYSMSKPITSVAVLVLMEEGALQLDDPVSRWLPELAQPQVLRDPAGSIDATEPAIAPIRVRHLLTHTAGLAYPFTASGPLAEALEAAGLEGFNSDLDPNEWMRRLGELPLADPPGERWRYGLSTDVLGVLVARVSGMPFEEFLHTRIFEPLGMRDTAFWVPPERLPRLAVNYDVDLSNGTRRIYDHPSDSPYGRRPAFASGGGGLVSTADDYLRFARMLLGGGELDGVRILSRKTVELMTSDALAPGQGPLRMAGQSLFPGQGFGLGVSVLEDLGQSAALGSPGRHGWGGAAGTYYFVDPREELVALVMTQLMVLRGGAPPLQPDFQTLVYQAIDDDGPPRARAVASAD